METINKSTPFNIPDFRSKVSAWITASYKSFRNPSKNSKEFDVTGPAKSLTAVVASVFQAGGYVELVTDVYRD